MNAPAYIESGSPAYWRAALALFLAGFSTFSLLYCIQPLLPLFARDYHVSAAHAALPLSATSGALAVAVFLAGALSQHMPRRALMGGSLIAASLCNIAASFAQPWWLLVSVRFVEGIALGGVPAVAMAYLAEEIHPRDLGKAMGQYVAGTAFGGMAGRFGIGVLTEFASWRVAIGVLGALCLLSALGFVALLPPSRHFTVKRGFDPSAHIAIWRGQLAKRALLRLFAIGFVLMGVFVTLFNYTGFRLAGAPYHLGQTASALVYLTYISGIFSSAFAGRMADRHGRRATLLATLVFMLAGVVLTLAPWLPVVVAGITLVTLGFFAGHAVAGGWVGAMAGPDKGHASALYLLFYYVGSSVLGWAGGAFWEGMGWAGVAGLSCATLLAGLLLALRIPEPERLRPVA